MKLRAWYYVCKILKLAKHTRGPLWTYPGVGEYENSGRRDTDASFGIVLISGMGKNANTSVMFQSFKVNTHKRSGGTKAEMS
jgi:hypothetical protein